MKYTYDLSALTWTITGFTPYLWRFESTPGIGETSVADVLSVRAKVPGSVQNALLEEGLLPNWNEGLNARACEWVENRHWVYMTRISREWLAASSDSMRIRLVCDGLDYGGWVRFGGRQIATFAGTHTPHVFDLSEHIPYIGDDTRLEIIFDCPPRWLGQFGYTSRMTEFKPRYNYTWDWTSRLVQIGIWDEVRLEIADVGEFGDVAIGTDFDVARESGILSVRVNTPDEAGWRLRMSLDAVRTERYELTPGENVVLWSDLDIEPWQPNGFGEPTLYDLSLTLIGPDNAEHDRVERRVGFKHVEWQPCEGAPAEADPWICVVNGEPVFLGGVNWTPIRPNFADVTLDDYRKRLETYQQMGCTVLRVWGGGFLEREDFYDLCDELGLLVWQEFPLSSSGLDNYPPDDATSIDELACIATSFVRRKRHHTSLLLWCGGNELTKIPAGQTEGMGSPIDMGHPLMQRFAEVVDREDPGRRFVPTSSSGPTFSAEDSFGDGVHWDVHGPWKLWDGMDAWEAYWANDDALFRSEVGAPGASGVALIERYRGDEVSFPASHANPLWRRTAWWIEWTVFTDEHGREPTDLQEYVVWSQHRQSRALEIAARACRDRFPRCGGFIVWMGHDSFPCTANTAVIDFEGEMKPAAHALAAVFRDDG